MGKQAPATNHQKCASGGLKEAKCRISALEALLARYFGLYNLAPVGYFDIGPACPRRVWPFQFARASQLYGRYASGDEHTRGGLAGFIEGAVTF